MNYRISIAILSLVFSMALRSIFQPVLPSVDERGKVVVSLRNSVNPSHGKNAPRLLILHMGPPKTATTSLQTELTKYNHTLFQDDQVLYMGRYYHPEINPLNNKTILNRHALPFVHTLTQGLRQCLLEKSSNNQRTCLAPLVEELTKVSPTSLLISDEALAKWDMTLIWKLKSILVPYNWHLKVVVTYRHFHQWLLSNFHQRFRLDKSKPRKDEWSGKIIPSLHEFWKRPGINIYDDIHPDETMVDHLLNFHDTEKTLLQQLMCLGYTPHTCRCVISKTSPMTVLNTAASAVAGTHWNYDRLATTAAALSWINTTKYSRPDVRQKLHELAIHQAQLYSPWDGMILSLPCPYDEYWNSTLYYERQILGTHDTTRADRSDIWDNPEFCGLDANATIHQDPWFTFLQLFWE